MTAATVQPLRLAPGRCGVRLHLFGTPAAELQGAMHPPWPRWMKRLYELEQATGGEIDVEEGVVTVSAAVSALKDKLALRLDVLAWVLGALDELGWEVELDGDTLVATAAMTPADARLVLEDAGVAGPMCAVTDLDSSGWPWIWSGDTPAAVTV